MSADTSAQPRPKRNARPNGHAAPPGGPSQLTLQVVEHVRALIQSGEVRPGDRLPPERELARRLQISRPSLRAGIGFLTAVGVLRSRHGAGTFVADGPPALEASTFSVLGSLHNFLPWQMFEARLVLESGLAALAAERATDHHVAALAEEVLEMEAAIEDSREHLIHDVRFHRLIAEAAGNPILGAFMETITAELYTMLRDSGEHTPENRQAATLHREIYRAIRARNPARARAAMERHLIQSRDLWDRVTPGALTGQSHTPARRPNPKATSPAAAPPAAAPLA